MTDMTYLELFKAIDGPSKDDGMTNKEMDDWVQALEELMSRPPFDIINELKGQVENLQKEVHKLKKHTHSDGKVCVPVEF